jgi:Family of unknown function (DUF6311)
MPAAAAFGGLVFLAIGGGAVLRPTGTGWIRPGSDWGYHWVGWLYFRNAPWGYPIGDTPNLFYPVGTTVGLMDGIPWVAVLAKLASPLLPSDWQHIGLWLGVCFVLQGWFGARLTATLGTSRAAIAAGGALFTVAPVLLHRVHHEALCAHFLLLAALAVYARRDPGRSRFAHVLLPWAAVGIHPYLAAMVLGIVLASLASDVWSKTMRPRDALWWAAAGFGGTVVLAATLGYFRFGIDALSQSGFGQYNADLLTLVDPQGDSRTLPSFAIQGGQEEGYGFLGLGVIALAVSAAPLAIRALLGRAAPLPWRRIVPYALLALLCSLFAVAGRPSVGGERPTDFSAGFDALGVLRGIFRSSGRFIWVPSYGVTVGAMALWLCRAPRVAPWILGGCLALQLADLRSFGADRFGGRADPPRIAAAWAVARGDYDHMALYPPRCGDSDGPCCPGFATAPLPEDMDLAALAPRLGLTYNGFGAARVPKAKFPSWCRSFDDDVMNGRLDRRTIYIVAPDREALFRLRNPAAPCRRVDEPLVCVAPDARGPFRDFVAGPDQRRASRYDQYGGSNPGTSTLRQTYP